MKAKSNRKNILNTLWMVFICVACFCIGWLANTWLNSDDQLMQDAYELIVNESLFNEKSETELSYAAIRGMLLGINDPYAELIEPEAAQDLVDTFAGNTGVVGLYAENKNGHAVIVKVFRDSAAYEAGVEVQDRIVSIDRVPIDSEADSSEIGLLLRGVAGSVVDLEIMKDGELKNFSLVRQEQEFLTYKMLPKNIGYISLQAFNEKSSNKMKQALQALLDQEPIGLIWDLRNNEGGDMFATQDILGYFIEDGLLFSAELSNEQKKEFYAQGGAFAENIPLVVLMDGTTYSAGETSASTISELGRGITIGSTSYGKGIIQATMPMRKNVLLQMTIAKWLSANGEWYHKLGVPADIEVFDDPETEIDEVLEKAIDFLISNQ